MKRRLFDMILVSLLLLLAACGEGEKTETLLICASGDTALYFVLEDETVVSVEYLPA